MIRNLDTVIEYFKLLLVTFGIYFSMKSNCFLGQLSFFGTKGEMSEELKFELVCEGMEEDKSIFIMYTRMVCELKGGCLVTYYKA